MACCKSCAKGAKIRGRKKRKSMARSTTTGITNIATVAAGYIVAQQVGKVPFLAANPALQSGAKIAIGILLPSLVGGRGATKKMIQGVGLGMAVNGASGLVTSFVPQLAGMGGVNYLPNPGSTSVHAVAGADGIVIR